MSPIHNKCKFRGNIFTCRGIMVLPVIFTCCFVKLKIIPQGAFYVYRNNQTIYLYKKELDN